MRLIIAFLLSILLISCATPPEVKQLSQKQIQYFVSAIDAVSKQSDALSAVANDIANEKSDSITAKAENVIARSQKIIATGGLSVDQANQVTQDIVNATKYAEEQKKNLRNDLAEIDRINRELVAYLSAMKDVQVALDGYLQSEQAGEKILEETLKHKSVQDLINKSSGTLSVISGNIGMAENIIKAMQGN